MIYKILKKDFAKKKIINSAVFLFIMLSALLMAAGTNMLIELSNSLDYLFEEASAPHFVQYHSGRIDQNEIDQWSAENSLIEKQQTGEMINIEGSNIFINSSESEKDTVMEMAFVKQNESFDFLLDLNNQKIELDKGEIAVPIYYMQKRNLSAGDQLIIKNERQELSFTIKNFVRDVQMNPSIISSKRFVVSESDFETLKNNFGELEYLISFQLNNIEQLNNFSNQYSSSNLPQKGPTIDIELLQLLNSLTDGLIAAVVILISILLNLIALLCLRFIIILTIEEDYKDIGVMKAVGIFQSDIKKIYLSKYIIIALTASLSGYLLSLLVNKVFSKNIMLYIGSAPKTFTQSILALISALLIALIVIGFSLIILRRLAKISAVEAMRMGSTVNTISNKSRFSLFKNNIIPTNIFLGIRDVLIRFKLYAILFFVFILSTFIIILPMNFLNTISSSEMVSYMGMVKSDIIMDLRQSDNIQERFKEIQDYLKNDPDVEKYNSYITSKFEIINADGYRENIYVETGDFSVFPIDYIAGSAPLLDNEIALSYLSAEEQSKNVGDTLELIIDQVSRTMIVTGIYQDITNGGKTAKADIRPDYETAVWYNINLNVNKNIKDKVTEYENNFNEVKIYDIGDYFIQTFGTTIDQLTLLMFTAVIIALLVTVLITSLFLKTLIAKDRSQIAIKKSIGISEKDIKIEYLTKSLVILNTAIIIGTIISNTLGQKIVSTALSIIGAPRIEFVINPLEAYILSPLIMITAVTVTALLSIKSIKEFSISDINAE
jgi:putative ABC transport system permease protein